MKDNTITRYCYYAENIIVGDALYLNTDIGYLKIYMQEFPNSVFAIDGSLQNISELRIIDFQTGNHFSFVIIHFHRICKVQMQSTDKIQTYLSSVVVKD